MGVPVSEDDLFNAVGTTGGVILACALLPQIVLAHKRRSAEDISYMWQAIYITGLVTLMTYYVHFELWAVFFPVAVECSCLIYLTALKVYFENVPGGEAVENSTQQKSPLVGESTSILDAKYVGGARRSPKIGKYGAAGGCLPSSPEAAPRV